MQCTTWLVMGTVELSSTPAEPLGASKPLARYPVGVQPQVWVRGF